MSGRVASTRRAGVETITFDNVARHNALSASMAGELHRLLDEAIDDGGVRVVVLRGAGGRAFMSGADIGEQDGDGTDGVVPVARAAIARIGEVPVPVVAVVSGWCLGAGMAVAAQADIRIASTSAVFGVPAARLGIGYSGENVARLTALVGPGAAADLLLTGRRVTAAEALGWGLVQACHEPQELDARAEETVQAIGANAPLSVRAAKRAVRVEADGGDGEGRAEVDRLVAACFASADYAEGRRAFAEKRAPRFTGR